LFASKGDENIPFKGDDWNSFDAETQVDWYDPMFSQIPNYTIVEFGPKLNSDGKRMYTDDEETKLILKPIRIRPDKLYANGVGTAIDLVPVKDMVAPEAFSEEVYIPWDATPWDMSAWDSRLFVPVFQDYITIARNSNDKNPWSRANRWFHIDVIRATGIYNNDPDYLTNTATYRNKAKRPIIEFIPDLKLYNSGTLAKSPVDFMDFKSTDPFVEVAGQNFYYPDVQTWTSSYPTGTATIGVSVTVAGVTRSDITILTADVSGSFEVGQYISDSSNTLPLDARVYAVQKTGTTTIISVEWSSVKTILVPVSSVSLVANGLSNGQYSVFDGARIIFANAADD
jgi:hypothetical protein